MAFLLPPQFKCLPATHFPAKFPAQDQPEDVCYRVSCMVSSTAVVDLEKPQVPSLEPLLAPLTSLMPLAYTGAVGLSLKEKNDTISAESLLAIEESVIEAAAAKALALARAAVVMAQQAAEMVGSTSIKEGKPALQNKDHKTIRSKCQTKRRAVGARSSERVTTSVVSDKPIIKSRSSRDVKQKKTSRSSRRKKQNSLHEQSLDPSKHARPECSTQCTCFTNAEVAELSSGVQNFLKLRRLQEEMTKLQGYQSTYDQWASAAGLDKNSLKMQLNHGIKCQEKLMSHNIGLVVSIARKYQNQGSSLDELIQDGMTGLKRATEKYDPSKGCKFATYAYFWIKQRIQKGLTDRLQLIRLPRALLADRRKANKVRAKLHTELGEEPDAKLVAAKAGLTMERYYEAMQTRKVVISLDDKAFDDGTKVQDVTADPVEPMPEDWLIKDYAKKELARAIDSLKPREKELVRWRYGLEDGRTRALQDIGELMKISRERVRQVEKIALRNLKKKLQNLHCFFEQLEGGPLDFLE